MSSFKQLNLPDFLLKVCNNLNYNSPTPIQQHSIPSILQGKNVLINSQTGTGKTAAFAFPILQALSKDPHGIFAIVLTANRELAF